MAAHHVTKSILMAAVALFALLRGGRVSAQRSIYRRGGFETGPPELLNNSPSNPGSSDRGHDRGHGGYGHRSPFSRRGYRPYGNDYGHTDTPDSDSSDCVSVRSAAEWHPYRSYGVKAASCEAVAQQQNRTEEVARQLDALSTSLTDQVRNESDRIDQLEQAVSALQGDGEIVFFLRVNKPPQGERFLCSFNSLVEVAEICRLLGFRIPNPFFFHLSCNDQKVIDLGLTCGTPSWLLKPNCLTPNGNSLPECLEPSPKGFVCNNFAFAACNGYSQGLLGEDTAAAIKEMKMSA